MGEFNKLVKHMLVFVFVLSATLCCIRPPPPRTFTLWVGAASTHGDHMVECVVYVEHMCLTGPRCVFVLFVVLGVKVFWTVVDVHNSQRVCSRTSECQCL
jgi:hypothetical protein